MPELIELIKIMVCKGYSENVIINDKCKVIQIYTEFISFKETFSKTSLEGNGHTSSCLAVQNVKQQNNQFENEVIYLHQTTGLDYFYMLNCDSGTRESLPGDVKSPFANKVYPVKISNHLFSILRDNITYS